MKTKVLQLLRKVYTFLFIVLVTSPVLMAQSSLSIGTLSSTPGQAVSIPVSASGFTGNMNAVTLKIDFNNSILTFTGITLLQLQTGLVANASGSTITIVNSNTGNPFQIDTGDLLNLNFIYNGGGTSQINFKPGTEITDSNLLPVAVILTNGSVAPATPPPTLRIGKVYAPVGSSVTVPVDASGFDPALLVGAITLKIGFPAGVLVSTSITSHQGLNFGYSATSNQVTLTWSSTTGKIIVNDLLAELKFNFITNNLATVKFNPGVIVSDIGFVTIPVQLTDGFVSELPVGYKVSGLLKYADVAGTPLSNSIVELWDETETLLIESTSTDGSGMYEFTGVVSANYVIKASTTKPVGGINVDDLWDLFDYLDIGTPAFSGIFLLAADFNNDGIINIDDVWDLFDYLDSGNTPANYIPWVFESHAITVNGADLSVDISGLCSGDVNASYNPIP